MKSYIVLCVLVVSVTISHASYGYRNSRRRFRTRYCYDFRGRRIFPGQSYNDGCNICRCGQYGQPTACTLMACPPTNPRDTNYPTEPNDPFWPLMNTVWPEGRDRTTWPSNPSIPGGNLNPEWALEPFRPTGNVNPSWTGNPDWSWTPEIPSFPQDLSRPLSPENPNFSPGSSTPWIPANPNFPRDRPWGPENPSFLSDTNRPSRPPADSKQSMTEGNPSNPSGPRKPIQQIPH